METVFKLKKHLFSVEKENRKWELIKECEIDSIIVENRRGDSFEIEIGGEKYNSSDFNFKEIFYEESGRGLKIEYYLEEKGISIFETYTYVDEELLKREFSFSRVDLIDSFRQFTDIKLDKREYNCLLPFTKNFEKVNLKDDFNLTLGKTYIDNSALLLLSGEDSNFIFFTEVSGGEFGIEYKNKKLFTTLGFSINENISISSYIWITKLDKKEVLKTLSNIYRRERVELEYSSISKSSFEKREKTVVFSNIMDLLNYDYIYMREFEDYFYRVIKDSEYILELMEIWENRESLMGGNRGVVLYGGSIYGKAIYSPKERILIDALSNFLSYGLYENGIEREKHLLELEFEEKRVTVLMVEDGIAVLMVKNYDKMIFGIFNFTDNKKEVNLDFTLLKEKIKESIYSMESLKCNMSLGFLKQLRGKVDLPSKSYELFKLSILNRDEYRSDNEELVESGEGFFIKNRFYNLYFSKFRQEIDYIRTDFSNKLCGVSFNRCKSSSVNMGSINLFGEGYKLSITPSIKNRLNYKVRLSKGSFFIMTIELEKFIYLLGRGGRPLRKEEVVNYIKVIFDNSSAFVIEVEVSKNSSLKMIDNNLIVKIENKNREIEVEVDFFMEII